MSIEQAPATDRVRRVQPDWPAPAGITALSTLRAGGVSTGVWAGLNLAGHTQDAPAAVVRNRDMLRHQLQLPAEPGWLEQVHGTTVVALPIAGQAVAPVADASFSLEPDTVCAVLTADCLPVLFCDRAGTWVAAAHAGWRGLCAGILEATVATAPVGAGALLAWLGPAIGPQAFEVGPELREAFLTRDPGAEEAFVVGDADRWLADLYQLARRRLQAMGVTDIYGGEYCTYSDPERFYSYRRDGQTGRQASLIWRSAT